MLGWQARTIAANFYMYVRSWIQVLMLERHCFANCHLPSPDFFLTHSSRPEQKFSRSFQILNLELSANRGLDDEKSLHLYWWLTELPLLSPEKVNCQADLQLPYEGSPWGSECHSEIYWSFTKPYQKNDLIRSLGFVSQSSCQAAYLESE